MNRLTLTNPQSSNYESQKSVTVLITTYKRAHLLPYVFSALKSQTYKNFDVLVVVKPSGDGTEDTVKEWEKSLKLNLIIQTSGHLVAAINLGLKHVTGDIIAFLDDDAIPSPDWIQSLVENYAQSNIGGVAGDVIPAFLDRGKVVKFQDKSTEVVPDTKPFIDSIGRKLWSCPLDGLEDYLVYVSKAGLVNYNFEVANLANNQNTKSLLGMGANMSVLAKALKGFEFPDSWVLGLSYEQFLGWHIWKKGYTLLFNPEAKVYHLAHGPTLTRNVADKRKATLRQIESQLLFHRLYDLEYNLSKMRRLTWIVFDTATDLKKICINKEIFRISLLKGKFYSTIIGTKWLLSKSFGGNYSPLQDLERIIA